ncbi:putative RNA-directed DNA polymerase from transposon X-element [Araneus ventricosus]|uniref:Putative RNA-directed DNA polymerase from transposon X-element n=1 Tax=Araneus ventricosus TaxID=182803 RepID=A0A4Y2P2H4_ARAVE|nr:putative RNA-directed DNA polymerase from transposon X-element [Araneus ventricosus]
MHSADSLGGLVVRCRFVKQKLPGSKLATEITPCLPSELLEHINKLKKGKSPGPDKITNQMIQRMPIKSLIRLTQIINGILKLKYFPNEWKLATIVPIIKPGKNPQDPSSYRPISLLSALSKIADAIILNRIEDTIDDQLIPYQFGFRRNLSTVQQLLLLTEFVREGMDEGWDTGAVFLDISKAFDRVWTDGLLYKLIKLRIPGSIVRLMATYLRGRRFAVRVGSNLSSERAIAAGVVQGSKVGPKLFNIYVNDIPRPRNCQTRLCLFADDTAVMNTGASNNITDELNSYLDLLGKWMISWKIKVNTDKCQAVYFSRRRNIPDNPKLYRRAIPWRDSTKYLGVIFYKRLTFKQHITSTRQKINAVKSILYPLIGKKSKLSLSNKLLLYKSLVRPVMSYASLVWGAAAKSNIQTLESAQNIIALQLTNSPWFIRNRYIAKDIKLQPIKDYFKKLAVNFFRAIENHSNPAIQEIPRYDPSLPRKKRRPRTLLLPD